MITEPDAIVECVKSAIASGILESRTEAPVSYQGEHLFQITRQKIRCTRCKGALVPQYKDGMKKWTKRKAKWVRTHADCAFG